MPKNSEIAKAARIIGRLGGLASAGKGGKKRFAAMTAEERSEFGRRAVMKRWAKAKRSKRKK